MSRRRAWGASRAILVLSAAVLAAWVPAAPAANQNVTATPSNQFTPATVAIKTNDSVTWNNAGGLHNVHFDDGSFDQPASPQSNAWSVMRTFTTPATLRYYCEVHGGPGGVGMSGTVVISPSYPRPTGATPMRVPLVPAFLQCTSPNSMHGGGLPTTQSCNNPQLVSSTVRLGSSSDSTARLGFARLQVCNSLSNPGCSGIGTAPDVRLFGNGSDIVCPPGAPASACPGGAGSDYDPNPAAGPYTAGLDVGTNPNNTAPTPICKPNPPNPSACAAGADMTAVAEIPGSTSASGSRAIRVTDTFNNTASAGDQPNCASTGTCSGTVRDQAFRVPVVCKGTSSNGSGSYCGANTTANAVVPGVVVSGRNAIVEIGQIQVFDSGPDGVRSNADDQLVAVQGVFVP